MRRRLGGHDWALLAPLALAAAGGVIVVSFYFAGEVVWPSVATEFAATFAAFALALWWNRREQRREEAEDAAEAHELRVTEARRRLEHVKRELLKNRDSIGDVRGGLPGRIVLPQLLSGAWSASAGPLGLLLADYSLMARLATFYGRIAELQWRLRARLELPAVAEDLDNMTASLADQLAEEVAGLIQDVTAQAADPDVRPLGLVHNIRIGPASESDRATSLVAQP